jgi:hypothetical protein
VLNKYNIEEEDKETLILLLVKKHRKLSGDAIQNNLDKLKELRKK